MDVEVRPQPSQDDPPEQPLSSPKRYRRLLIFSVSSVTTVAAVPLIVMTLVNYYQYQDAFNDEAIRPILRLTTNTKLSLESFLSERVSALSLALRTASSEELRDAKYLHRLLINARQSFGGFIDLTMIDDTGKRVSYAGPEDLGDKNYKDEPWFHEASLQGEHISEVFRGPRGLPRFLIAVAHESEDHGANIMQATLDTRQISRQIRALATKSGDDAFIISNRGVLQTQSRLYGKALAKVPFPVPAEVSHAELMKKGYPGSIVGFAYVDRSPFIVVLVHPRGAQEGWAALRGNLVLFLLISMALVFGVVVWGSMYMVNRERRAELMRAAVMHKMEYTNKMAAIGRLAAGVAHEVNNPVAIIKEKAGLLEDILEAKQDPADIPREKILNLVKSVISSADRVGNITHRLLGFAKHMDVDWTEIDLVLILKEVVGFLEKEAAYRNLNIEFDVDEDVPLIESDRGQLQQVFLNIVNNAFAAVSDGGHVKFKIERVGDEKVSVSIEDDGVGIKPEHLARIFDPFFTTRKGVGGTGLGLSITYGIVEKLKGEIKVRSERGKGTCFTIILPARRD